jgi:hypothetical protein
MGKLHGNRKRKKERWFTGFSSRLVVRRGAARSLVDSLEDTPRLTALRAGTPN